jgi:pimeloyl-ACP methyl ester carboxylesterase
MPYAKLKDVHIYFEIYGNELELKHDSVVKKPTIVALHGGPGIDHCYYEVPFLKDAAEFAQVIFLDLRGNGRSIDTNPQHWSLDQWAKDLGQFCDYLGLEKPYIYGCSLGGWVAMKYALLYPQQAKGLILIDTEAYLNIDKVVQGYEKKGNKEIGKIAKEYYTTKATPELMQQYFEKCIPLCAENPIPENWIKRTILNPEVNIHTKEYEYPKYNILQDIPKIVTPTLYLSNTTNPLHHVEVAKETAAAFTAPVIFKTYENCGLVALDAKDKALAEIKKFVSTNEH